MVLGNHTQIWVINTTTYKVLGWARQPLNGLGLTLPLTTLSPGLVRQALYYE